MSQEALDILRRRDTEISASVEELRSRLRLLEADLRRTRTAIEVLTGEMPNREPTIMSLVLDALRIHFEQGAVVQQILDFIRDTHGREIARTSLSPQLTRLQARGLIKSVDGFWTAVAVTPKER